MTCAEYFRKKKQIETARINAGIESVLAIRQIEFTVEFVCLVHKEIFCEALPKIAGVFRQKNIKKHEFILLGRSVQYAPYTQIREELGKLLDEVKQKNFSEVETCEQKLNSAANFALRLWKTHPFENGNTRLTAVMLVLYLRHIGFTASNEPFKMNAALFRNALVCAAYSDERVKCDSSFLYRFLYNAFLGGQHDISECMQPRMELCKKK